MSERFLKYLKHQKRKKRRIPIFGVKKITTQVQRTFGQDILLSSDIASQFAQKSTVFLKKESDNEVLLRFLFCERVWYRTKSSDL